MKHKILTGIVLLSTFLTGAPAMAQDDPLAAKHFLEKVQQAYEQSAYLSFRVQYRYANKNQPGTYIDTLSGEMAMDKKRIRTVLDGTETVMNGKYNINVVPDEKLIYLSKPSRMNAIDPMSIVDSVLLKMGKAVVIKGDKSSTLDVRFPPGMLYDRITMTIDNRTGYFQKVIYDLQARNFVSDDQMDQPGHTGAYQQEGQVEMIFSHYRQGQFDDSLFDEALYFTRQGQRFEPSERYSGYRVFVASLNL